MKNFDAVFQHSSTERPTPTPAAAEVDLSGPTTGPPEQAGGAECECPPSMSADEFKQKYTEVTASVTINMGQNVLCQVAAGKCFISCATQFKLPGVQSMSAKPLFLYAGGSWISDSNKAKDFLAKPANEGKGVEFRLESSKDMVPWRFSKLSHCFVKWCRLGFISFECCHRFLIRCSLRLFWKSSKAKGLLTLCQ